MGEKDDKILFFFFFLGGIKIKLLSTENEIMINEVISLSAFMFWGIEYLGTVHKNWWKDSSPKV